MMRTTLIAATSGSATFLAHAGRLWVSGTDNFGELGLAPPHRATLFDEVPLPHPAHTVVASSAQTLVITHDGTLCSAGHSATLGLPPSAAGFRPVQTPGPVRSAAACISSVLVALHDGSLWKTSPPPHHHHVASPWERLHIHAPAHSVLGAAGEFFVLCDDGSLSALGPNRLGALGTGTTAGSDHPRLVRGLPAPVVALATSGHHTLAALADGSLWAAGSDRRGETGHQPDTTLLSFSRVLLDEPVVQVATGTSHSVVLTASGGVLTAGAGERGQLGRRRPSFRGTNFGPLVDVSADAVAAGGDVTVVVSDADVLVSGDNRSAQLGLRSRGESCVLGPIPVLPDLPDSLLESLATSRHLDPDLVLGLARSWSGSLTELLDSAALVSATRD